MVTACVANPVFFFNEKTSHCQMVRSVYWLSKHHYTKARAFIFDVCSEEFPLRVPTSSGTISWYKIHNRLKKFKESVTFN